MIDIKVGQIYSFHKDPKEPIIAFAGAPDKDELIALSNIVMEVARIDGAIFVTPLKDKTGWFQVGKEYVAKQTDIVHSGRYRLLWDPIMVGPKEEEYGMDCTKCKKHYPHAVRAANFRCWSCRNGF